MLCHVCEYLALALESPIPNLDASLLASSSRTTVIAIQRSAVIQDTLLTDDYSGDDSVLILTCTKVPEASWIRRHEEEEDPSSLFHFLHESLGLTCVTTGLTSDTQYLVQTAREYLTLLEYTFPTKSYHSLATHKFVKDAMAQTLRRATDIRPLAVQTLIVGNNPSYSTMHQKIASLGIYTVDPSGTWKHWGSGLTCIGLYAETIRRHLLQKYILLTEENYTSLSMNTHPWEQRAIELAVQALLHALLLEEDVEDVASLSAGSDDKDSIIQTNTTSLYLDMDRGLRNVPLIFNHGHIHAMVVHGDEQMMKKNAKKRWGIISPSFIRDIVRTQIQNATMLSTS